MAAADLYRGDLVDAFGVGPEFEQWLDAERERLRSLAHGVVAELCTHDLDPQSAQLVQDLARRLLAADRPHEGACLSLMQLYASTGLRSKALEVHAEFATRLHDELGLEPGARIAALAATLSAPSHPTASVAFAFPGIRATVDPRVSDLMMRGWQLFTLYTADGMAGARESYAAAIELDPVHVRALSMLGWTHWFDAIGGWSDDAAASLALADRLACRALGNDDDDAIAHALAGKVRLWQQRHAQAWSTSSGRSNWPAATPMPSFTWVTR